MLNKIDVSYEKMEKLFRRIKADRMNGWYRAYKESEGYNRIRQKKVLLVGLGK
jgi:hypothetical protein